MSPLQFSPLLASDFSGLIYILLAILAVVALIAVILPFLAVVAGTVTAGILSRLTKRRWIWRLAPLFTALWFALGWAVLSQME